MLSPAPPLPTRDRGRFPGKNEETWCDWTA
jgi:hypothetical protein